MFYIFDCNYQLIGNPKGYATHQGAQRQCENEKSQVKKTIWTNYWNTKSIHTGMSRAYSIMNEGMARERNLI